jgi:hypothetical protein
MNYLLQLVQLMYWILCMTEKLKGRSRVRHKTSEKYMKSNKRLIYIKYAIMSIVGFI